MNDIVYEQLISRRNRSIDIVFKALIYAVIIALFLTSFIIGVYGLMLTFAMGFIAYYLIFPRFYVEYEYTLINKDLDIDIIFKRESRKSGMHLDLTKVELIAPLSSSRIGAYGKLKQVNYSACDPTDSPYAIITKHKQDMICVLIQMNDDLYNHLRLAVPRNLYKD